MLENANVQFIAYVLTMVSFMQGGGGTWIKGDVYSDLFFVLGWPKNRQFSFYPYEYLGLVGISNI